MAKEEAEGCPHGYENLDAQDQPETIRGAALPHRTVFNEKTENPPEDTLFYKNIWSPRSDVIVTMLDHLLSPSHAELTEALCREIETRGLGLGGLQSEAP